MFSAPFVRLVFQRAGERVCIHHLVSVSCLVCLSYPYCILVLVDTFLCLPLKSHPKLTCDLVLAMRSIPDSRTILNSCKSIEEQRGQSFQRIQPCLIIYFETKTTNNKNHDINRKRQVDADNSDNSKYTKMRLEITSCLLIPIFRGWYIRSSNEGTCWKSLAKPKPQDIRRLTSR